MCGDKCAAWRILSVTRLIQMNNLTRWQAQHESFIRASFPIKYINLWHDASICVTWLIHMCDMNRLLHMCNLTRLYVYHDSSIFVTWLIRICVTRLSHRCNKTTYSGATWLLWSKETPPPGGFPIYYVPSSRIVCKGTPLEAPGTNSSRGVLLHTVLDEGT